LQLIIEAGRPWEAVWAGRLLLHLERLTGYGFVVDVAAVRKVDLDDDGGEEVEEQEDTLLPLLRGLAKRDLCRCVTGEGEPPRALLLEAIACAGSGEIRGIPVEELRADTLSSLDLEGRMIGPEGAMLIGIVIPLNAVLKNCYLLKNSLNVESATMLTKIGAEKGIMLSGMTRDQTYSDFSSQNLRPADAILIACDLKFMAVVTTLDLRFNSIGNEGAKAIAEALKVTAVVTTLRLNSNIIGNEGAKAIAEALKVTAVVTTLRLNSNIIGDEGAIAIAEALKVNAVLTTLRLDANKIGAEGAKAIEEALKVNAVLTELWFGHNQIGDEGAKAIAEALKLGTAVMTTLSLAKNMIGDDGAMAIAEALKANAVLIRLVLHHNNIGDDGAKAIAEVLKVNAVVTKLNIKYNNMGVAGQQAMQDAVSRTGVDLNWSGM
jgi:hypothetical protein